LVGDKITIADFCVAIGNMMIFQTLIDDKWVKQNLKLMDWFKRVTTDPAFMQIIGVVRPCTKPLDPVLAAAKKPAAPAKKPEVAPVEKVVEKAKPAKAEPETDFVMYDYKTFLVNLKDMKV